MRTAWSQALPIVLGYLPISSTFGILATKAGISPFNTLAMSLIVYAGSGQLIAVGLFAAGFSPYTIILTTFIVNLRHSLMSTALSPYLKSWRRWLIPIFAFQLTDETFVVHSMRFAEAGARPGESIAINVISYLSWFSGTVIGVAAGDLITDVKPFGLDYALIAMFIALLVFQMQNRKTLAVAVIAGLIAVALQLAGFSQWNVILATLTGATAGVFIDVWTRKSSS